MIYNYDNLLFNIITAKVYFHENGTFNVKERPFSALSIRTKGYGTFEINGKTYNTEVGDLLFLPENTPYIVKYDNSESIVVHLSDCNYKEVEKITLKNFERYKLLFKHIVDELKSGFSVNGAKSFLYGFLQSLNNDFNPLLSAESDKAFIEVIKYINANFSNSNLNYQDICKRFFISEATLRRKFKRYFNISFIDYLTKLRLDKAFSMLSSGNVTATQTCYECGYVDPKYFSRIFKKKFNIQPSNLIK